MSLNISISLSSEGIQWCYFLHDLLIFNDFIKWMILSNIKALIFAKTSAVPHSIIELIYHTPINHIHVVSTMDNEHTWCSHNNSPWQIAVFNTWPTIRLFGGQYRPQISNTYTLLMPMVDRRYRCWHLIAEVTFTNIHQRRLGHGWIITIIYRYSSEMLEWHWVNRVIAPVPVK